MVAAEGTIKSFRFGSAFSGFTAQRLIERFKAAGDATWDRSNGWNEPSWGTAYFTNKIIKKQWKSHTPKRNFDHKIKQ